MSTHNICFRDISIFRMKKVPYLLLCTCPLMFKLYLYLLEACVDFIQFSFKTLGVVRWCKGVVYLTSLRRPSDIGLHLGKACYPCSGEG